MGGAARLREKNALIKIAKLRQVQEQEESHKPAALHAPYIIQA